jgi:hypothetical protein
LSVVQGRLITFAIDLDEHVVQVPTPLWPRPKPIDTLLADLRGARWPEPLPPEPDGFMADVDATLVHHVLDIAERQGKPHVQHHRQADHLRAALEALERITFGHAPTLRSRPARLDRRRSDNASGRLEKLDIRLQS